MGQATLNLDPPTPWLPSPPSSPPELDLPQPRAPRLPQDLPELDPCLLPSLVPQILPWPLARPVPPCSQTSLVYQFDKSNNPVEPNLTLI